MCACECECVHAKPENKTIAGKQKCKETLMSCWTTQNAHREREEKRDEQGFYAIVCFAASSFSTSFVDCLSLFNVSIYCIHRARHKTGTHTNSKARWWVRVSETKSNINLTKNEYKKYDLFLAFCCNHLRVLAKTIFLVFSFFSSFVFFPLFVSENQPYPSWRLPT